MKLGNRKVIYKYFAQGIPSVYTIDKDNCVMLKRGKCGACQKFCPAGAIAFEQKDEEIELGVGAIVVASGFDTFDPTPLTEYGYGRLKNVVTALEFERLISASGPTEGHLKRPSDGKLAHKLGFIQCVGSRNLRTNAYCSSFCCMHSIKESMLAREHEPETEAYVFYMDLRTVGKGFEQYKRRGAEQYGINYIRGRVAEITQDEQMNPLLWYEDTEAQEVKHLPVDLVVLATACVASKGSEELAARLGVEADESHFILTDPLHPADTSVPGILACGCCQGPVDIPESVAQASSTAARAAEIVTAG